MIKSWINNHSDSSDNVGDNHSDSSDNVGDNHSDSEIIYLKERVFVLEKFLDKEQTSNSELKKIIQQTQNLLDQQQRLALQDKKLLEEYKVENDSLKALKMPSQEFEKDQLTNQSQDVIEKSHTAPKKWYQFWK